MIEKLLLLLVNSVRRLRPYFQSHQIKVKIDHSIRQILQKPELTGRMVAWSIELSEFGLKFKPQGPIKTQCLDDFMVEFPPKLTSSDKGNW